MSCGVGHRHGSDMVLLWLWHMPATTAPIRPLAWDLPYAMGVALKKIKDQKKKKRSIETSPLKRKEVRRFRMKDITIGK